MSKMVRILPLLLLIVAAYTPAAWGQAPIARAYAGDAIKQQQMIQSARLLDAQLDQSPRLYQSMASKHALSSRSTGEITGVLTGIRVDEGPNVLAFSLADTLDHGELWFVGEVQADGSYSIRDLPEGAYYVLVEAPGYLPAFYDNVMAFDEATLVPVVANQVTADIDFAMEPFPSGDASISGTVLGADGDVPGRGAVTAYMVDNSFVALSVPLGEDGSYTIENLAPGSYYIQAFGEGYLPTFYENAERVEDATPVTVESTEVAGIDFTLSLGGSIAGRVVDQEGNPQAGVQVFAEWDFRVEPPVDGIIGHGFATTNDDGFYRIGGLTDGSYLVQVQQEVFGFGFVTQWYDGVSNPELATAIAVTRDQEASGIDFVVEQPSGFGSVAGRVTFTDGTAITRAVVEIMPVVSGDSSHTGWFGQAVDVDAEGRYTFERVVEGDYLVAVHLWEMGFSDTFFYPGTTDRAAATVITVVEDGVLSDIDLAINPGGRISGQVTDQDGHPLPHVEVLVQTKSGPAGPFRPDRFYWAATDEDGNYSVAGLPADDYYVRVETSTGFAHVVQWYDGVFDQASATPVTVLEDQESAGINFTLLIPNEFGTLAGQVAFSNGQPVTFGTVEARLIGASGSPDSLGGIYGSTTYIDRSGHYTFEQLPVGDYLIRATIEMADGLRQSLWYDGAATESDATPVAVVQDQRTEGIDFAFSPGATISGRVTDQLGNPLEGVQVIARTDIRRYYSRSAVTDANGDYQLIALEDGQAYHLEASFYGPFVATSQDYALPVTATEVGTTNIDFVLDMPTAFGSIAGRVIDTDGQPISGALIYVGRAMATTDSLTGMVDPDGGRGQYTETDRSGTYRFDDVPVGDYILYVQLRSNTVRYPIWYPNATTPQDATPITVLANAETGEVDFVVPTLDGVIRGTLTDANGKAIPNSSVQLESLDGTGFLVRSYAGTDKEGNFMFTEVPDGQYRLLAYGCAGWQCVQEWWDGATQPDDATPIVVTGGVSDPQQINFQISLEQGTAVLAGVVTRASDGSPLTHAFVSITAQNDEGVWTSAYANTDSTGRYRVENLPPGTYTAYAAYWENEMTGQAWFDGAIQLDDATPIVVTDGSERTDINFSLDVRPMFGSIAGVVTDAATGAPLERAYVEVNPTSMNYYEDRIAFFQPNVAVTDAEGRFQLDRLWAGHQEYAVRVFANGRQSATIENVAVIGGEIAQADTALVAQNEGSGTISGRITSREGIPVEVAVVQAMQQTETGGVGATYTAVTAEDGTYTLTGLGDGSYILMSFAPWHIGTYYDGVYDPADASPVLVENGGAVSEVNFALDAIFYLTSRDEAMVPGVSSGTSVFGRVTNEDGEPVADATVYVLNAEETPVSFTRTHADGSYELAEVPPGAEYRLKATALGYRGAFHDGTTAFTDAEPVATNTGRMEMDFMLHSNASSVGIDPEPTLPTSIELLGNYPNPFNPTTRIVFALPERMHITLRVYDTLGRDLGVFFEGTLDAGQQNVVWNATTTQGGELSSGVYFYQLEGSNQTVRTGKMLLLR